VQRRHQVRNIDGELETLKQNEVDFAEETLGIHMAPDGNRKQQVSKMMNMARDWVALMREGNLSRSEMWMAVQSTLWRTLIYPLPAINLMKKECEAIMAPIIEYILPALGICRNFPRSIVFAPKEFFGLGIQHLHTIQEILRLKDIVQHTFQESITGL
jgi:hypothetical protein